MKLKKSVLSIVTVIIMSITSLGSTLVFAATPDTTESLKRVQALGILDSSITNVNSAVTRGQFAKALVAADNLIDGAQSLVGSTVFPDVSTNSDLSGYVNILTQKGLLYGTVDGYFHPEKAITYAEACTSLVKLLGYSDSDVTGTWPSNYISKASDLQLIQKISLKKNDSLTVGAAALMFDRLFGTNIKQVNGAAASKTFLASTNLYQDYVILANSRTSADLANNAVLTDKGTLYLQEDTAELQAGATYRLSVASDNTIDKIYGQINNALNLIVNSYQDNIVYYQDNGISQQMNLPSNITYYYNGTKQDYSNLSNIIKVDDKIVFEYNTSNTGYSYAVIVDPLYSMPVIASNFDQISNNIGSITFDTNIPIIKNGKTITKADILDMDVVYNVTDIDGNNRSIQVINNRVEGNITNISINGTTTTGIQIDNVNYNFSKSMDVSSISSLKTGTLVSALEGYDGKIIAVKSIDHKLGKLSQGIIVGNSKTSDNLADNQVFVNQGTNAAVTYNTLKDIGELSIGVEYSFYADGNTITKINEKLNSVENYAVSSIEGSTVSYTDDNKAIQTITLPQASAYYYHGLKIDYSTALSEIQPYSSIVLVKSSEGTGYSYGVIADPSFSNPSVYKPSNTDLISKLNNTSYAFIRKDGMNMLSASNLTVEDVVYFISDLWNKNTYVYVNDTTVVGRVTALLPNKVTPNTIQVNGTNYALSPYFDKSKLFNYNANNYTSVVDNIAVGNYVILVLGIDGKVVDIY